MDPGKERFGSVINHLSTSDWCLTAYYFAAYSLALSDEIVCINVDSLFELAFLIKVHSLCVSATLLY
jgi:hypothetical protein